VVAFMCEASEESGNRKDGKPHKPLNRHQSVLLVSCLVIVVIVLCVLSMTGDVSWLKVFGYNLFDGFDKLTSCLAMPLGALGMALFVGWFMPQSPKGRLYADNPVKQAGTQLYILALRWLVPIAIVVILLDSIGML